jgi:hypothetical protein
LSTYGAGEERERGGGGREGGREKERKETSGGIEPLAKEANDIKLILTAVVAEVSLGGYELVGRIHQIPITSCTLTAVKTSPSPPPLSPGGIAVI